MPRHCTETKAPTSEARMDILYLSPEFPPNYAPFILRLDELGADVWALGEADFYTLPERLRQAIRYYVRTDLRSEAHVERSLAELLDAKAARGTARRFDLVESHNEIWLGLEAHINERLAIPGLRPADLPRLKRKSAMKRQFAACGLPTARGERIESPAHARRLAGEIGFPLILKPDEGVGAGGIHRVADADRLEALMPALEGDYLMEAFVDAPIVSYDGLADGDGRLLFENSLIYGDGVLEYVHGRDTFFYVTRRIPERLKAIGRRLVEAFAVRRKFFHFEFFVVDGGYLPIEINCRPPGGAILDMMNYSVDADLYAAYARMVTGRGEAALPADKAYYCAYAGRRDRDYAFTHEQLRARLGNDLVEFGENPPIFQAAMSRYRYIVRATDLDRLLAMVGDIQRPAA